MQIGGICIFILCIGVILGCQAFWNYKKLHRRMDPVNEFLKANYQENNNGIPIPTKHVLCRDSFSISIQANHYTYCEPREDKAWPYSTVELGFPSELDDIIDIYAEEYGTTETVFGYVPINIVNKLIKKHGGYRGNKELADIWK